MVTPEENAAMTEVGPGTKCGALLRRYWMPICPAAELTPAKPKRRVRLMGENLVLFRDGSGRHGLVPEQCPHRRASLYHGFVEEDGLRCAYHGWKVDVAGTCLEQPFEPAGSPLKAEACVRAYPVQQLAGLLFAYLGPDPAPLLPRWETAVRKDGTRAITVLPLHNCNWLQAQENSVDPVHTYYLHAHTLMLQARDKRAQDYFHRPIEKFEFDLVHEPAWTGVRKRRTYGGDNPEQELGHPAVFPNILINPQNEELVIHWRVPVDDRHTSIIWLRFSPSRDGGEVEQADADIPLTYLPHPRQSDGEYDLRDFPGQDLMAWETQGPVFDRTTELLGTSDRGVVMWRKLLLEQIAEVAAGRDPVGVIRDPSLNEVVRVPLSLGRIFRARAMEMAGS
jgi:5,5'-dehydrodivanillate O-demethylase oxygenase subunit